MASGGEPEIVVNELLCFITNKMLTLPMQMIVQLCVNFYDDDIILSAKTQLHELRPCENTTRVIRRKGPNRKESSVEDIYKFLDELGENVPTFVAHDLAALPPIAFENIDLCTLLRAVQNSRDELAIITQTLSEQSVVNKDLSARLFDVERGFVDGTSRTPENVPPFISPPRVERPATSVAPPAPRSALMPLPPDDDSETADSESDSSETAIKTADVPLAATHDDVVSEETPPPLTEGWSAVVRKPRQRQKPAPKNEVPVAKAAPTDNTHSHSTRKHMAAGKARGTGLNVAQRQRFASVFVTGFTADVEAVQIREHVETCTGLKVEVVKLDTKHDTYSSFHVKATCDNPSVFMDDDLWPEGVRYRWFKPARANPTQS